MQLKFKLGYITEREPDGGEIFRPFIIFITAGGGEFRFISELVNKNKEIAIACINDLADALEPEIVKAEPNKEEDKPENPYPALDVN